MQPELDIPTNIPDITTAYLSPDSIAMTVAKIAFILVAIMYVVYGVVIVRQVKIMNETVTTTLGPILQLVAWLHLALTIIFALGVIFIL